MTKRYKCARAALLATMGAMGAMAGYSEAAVLERVGLYAAPADGINAPFALATSVDGRQLYAADLGWLGSVDIELPGSSGLGVLSTDRNSRAIDGSIGFIQDGVAGAEGLAGIWAVAATVDGKSVYAIGSVGNAVVHFERNASTGALTFKSAYRNGAGISGLNVPKALVMSSNGGSVFVAGSGSNSIVEFSRNTTTGALTFVRAVVDNAALEVVNSLALSQDGTNLYAASSKVGVLTLLTRGNVASEWRVANSYRNDENGIQDMSAPRALTLSADGRNLYVANRTDGTSDLNNGSLLAFKRNVVSGELSFVRGWRDSAGVDVGVQGVANLSASADGAHIFATSPTTGTLSVWRRDASTGLLRSSEVLRHQANYLDGLAAVQGLALAPDDSMLYTSSVSEPIASYRVRTVKLDASTIFTAGDGRALPTALAQPSVKPLETVRLGLKLRNNAAIDASAVAVSGMLPDGAVFVGVDGGPEQCDRVGNAVLCELGGLEANTEKTYNVDFKLAKAGPVNVEWHVVSDQRNIGNTSVAQHLAFYVNTPPAAIADEYDALPNTVYRFSDLLANDKDADADVLLLASTGDNGRSKQGGRVEYNGTNTTVVYTPPTGFTGEDEFNYTITDGHGGESEATVKVFVGIGARQRPSGEVVAASSGPSGGAIDGLVGGLFSLIALSRLRSQRGRTGRLANEM